MLAARLAIVTRRFRQVFIHSDILVGHDDLVRGDPTQRLQNGEMGFKIGPIVSTSGV